MKNVMENMMYFSVNLNIYIWSFIIVEYINLVFFLFVWEMDNISFWNRVKLKIFNIEVCSF